VRTFAPTEQSSFSKLSSCGFHFCAFYCCNVTYDLIFIALQDHCSRNILNIRWIDLKYFVIVVALISGKKPKGFRPKTIHASSWTILTKLQMVLRFWRYKVQKQMISSKTLNFNAEIFNLVIFFRSSEFFCESSEFCKNVCGSAAARFANLGDLKISQLGRSRWHLRFCKS